MLERFNNSPPDTFQAFFSVKDAIQVLVELTSTELGPGETVEWISSNPAAFRAIATNGAQATVSYGPQVGTGSLTANLKDANGNILKTFQYYQDIDVQHSLPLERDFSDIIVLEP